MEGETLAGVALAAGFGASVPATALRPLAGRAYMLKEPEQEDFRPVLHIVSGFLGSGKTTFLSEWLAWLHNHDRHTAVLQNELGEKSLDSSLLEHETVSETLDEGCVCCTLADSLRPAIRRLMNTLPTEHILLETTGLANPGAVRDVLDDLADMVRPGLCISLVDALDGERVLACGPEGPAGLAGEQIRQAGVLVCNKADTVPPIYLTRITDVLKRMNPNAVVFNASHGRIPFGELDRILECARGPGSRAAEALRPKSVRRLTHRDEGYESFMLEVTRPMDIGTLAALVRTARDRVPRIKGVVDSVEENRPILVQYAAGRLSLETPLSPPGPDRFLVFIGKELNPEFVTSLRAHFR